MTAVRNRAFRLVLAEKTLPTYTFSGSLVFVESNIEINLFENENLQFFIYIKRKFAKFKALPSLHLFLHVSDWSYAINKMFPRTSPSKPVSAIFSIDSSLIVSTCSESLILKVFICILP